MPQVERALDAALLVMKSGGSTRVADRTLRNVLKVYGLEDFSAAWRLDFVIVRGALAGVPVTAVRPIGGIGVNLVCASAAVLLGERAARGEIAPADIASEIDRVDALRPSGNRWMTIGAAAVTAAAFSRLMGGDWGAFGIAFVAAGITQSVRSVLQARKQPVVRVTLASGVLSASLAAAALRLDLSQTVPATLVSAVIFMVPGLPLINGFLDLVSHEHLPAGLERMANALVLFLTLALAIAFAYTVIL